MRFVLFLVLVVLALIGLWFAMDSRAAQKTCEVDHSFDVCFQSLN